MSYSNVATLRTNVATLQRVQKHSIPMSRRCPTTSRRSRLVLGQFSAHFEPRIDGFKAQTPRKQKGRRLGLEEGDFVHTLGLRRRFGVVFEDLGEDHELCGRKSKTHHHLIIIVSSSSFLMFYPKFMMYQTFIMF